MNHTFSFLFFLTVSASISSNTANNSWTLQATLSQNNKYGFEGNLLALSGDSTTLVANTYLNNITTAGVEIYVKSGSTWTHEITIPQADDDTSGFIALSNDGNTLAIGSPSTNQQNGVTYVYVRTGSSWSQQAVLSQQNAGSDEGVAVALSADGNTLAVGAWALNLYAGATHIYVRTGSTWQHQATLSQLIDGAWEGSSVSLSADGNILAVGAPFDNITGSTQIYSRDGTQWTHQASLTQKIMSSDEGGSVSLSADGTILAAGASFFNRTGAAQVYNYVDNKWSYETTLSQKIAASQEGIVVSVAPSGTILATGAPYANNYTGCTNIYIKSGNVWSYQTTLSQLTVNATEGNAVSFSNDGSMLAVGASHSNKGSGETLIYSNDNFLNN